MLQAFGFFALILAVCTLCIIALAVVLMRERSVDSEDNLSHAENVRAARERVAQLDARVEAGTLNEATADEYRQEIEDQLLRDTASQSTSKISGRRDLAGVSLTIVAIFIGAPLLYAIFGSPNMILPPELRVAAMADAFHGESTNAQQQLAASDDGEAQIRLAEQLMEEKNYPAAAKLYANVRALVGNSPQLLAANLNAQILAGDDIEELLDICLEVAPSNPFFLWIAGLNARDKGDFGAAKVFWKRTFAALPPGSTEQARVSTALAQLDQEMQAGTDQTPPAAQAQTADEATAAQADISATAVEVSVSLAPELASKVKPGDALFVFARAHSGPALPLAVQRMTAGELPTTIVLNDELAMMPELKMSLFDNYTIVARISKHGDVMAKRGDLYGETTARPGAKINLLIDQQTP